jgi:hypothetical protein
MHINLRRYGLYLLRWQASTPLLAAVEIILFTTGPLIAAIIANLIGGLIFFWVDQYIFTSQRLAASWQVRDEVTCSDCGKIARGYRLVQTSNYDRTNDPAPEFRCEQCSGRKADELRSKGIRIE